MARKKRTVNGKRPNPGTAVPNKTALPPSTGLSHYFKNTSTNWAVYAAICVILLGCAVQQRWSTNNNNNIRQVTAAEKYKRFTAEFPSGNKVEVRNIMASSNEDDEGWGAGTFATSDISKGELIMMVDHYDNLPNEATKKEAWYQQLTLLVEAALAPYDIRPSTEQMMTAVVLLMEVDKGRKSQWHSYIEALPANVSQMAWYWTDDEMRCVVPWPFAGRTTAEMLGLGLRNFHEAFEEVSRKFTPLTRLAMSSRDQLRERAEWAYLMVLTRCFTSGILKPMLDMANHDPIKSTGVIDFTDASALVATHDIKAGEQVFNSYGDLFPTKMAAMYGFVDPNAAYVYVPSLTVDMQKSPHTSGIDACTQTHLLFFGNVTEGRVEAHVENVHQMTYYKPFRPTKLAYQCARVLLQSKNGQTIARYMAEKLQQDAVEYESMASAEHCQSDRGSFPLIRETNAITARLLQGAAEVARQAERGQIEYPDIPY